MVIFNQVLAREPALYDCRKALRAAQHGKAGDGKGFFKKVLSSAGSSPAIAKGEIALRKDPLEALQIAEQVLNHDANNSGAHRLVVKASTALEFPRTAVMSLEILVKNSPKDWDLAIQFANTLADAGEVNRAEKILADLLRLVPGLHTWGVERVGRPREEVATDVRTRLARLPGVKVKAVPVGVQPGQLEPIGKLTEAVVFAVMVGPAHDARA